MWDRFFYQFFQESRRTERTESGVDDNMIMEVYQFPMSHCTVLLSSAGGYTSR